MSHLVTNAPTGTGIKNIAGLAWPIMLSMLSYTVVDVTDTLMVGWLGTAELAAVGVATTILLLIKAFFIGLFESVKILSAQAAGAKDQKALRSYAWNGVYIALPFVLTVGFLPLFSKSIFALFGGPIEVQEMAVRFFNIAIYAPVFWFFTLAIVNFLQGTGNTKTPMRVNLLVCGMNVVLDAILIYGFGPIPAFNIEGAAIATVISTAVGSLILFSALLKRTGMPDVLSKKTIGKLFAIGWPSGVRFFFDIAGYTIFTAMIARLGKDELAANQIAVKILCISVLPCWGIAEATCILIGNFSGARKFKEVQETFTSALKVTLMVVASFGVIFIVFKTPIVSLFQEDPGVLLIAPSLIVIVAFFQFFEGIQNTCALALSGTGDTKFPMFASLAGCWLFMLPMAYFLGLHLGYGVRAMWLVSAITLVFVSTADFIRFRQAKWKGKDIQNETDGTDLDETAPGQIEPVSQNL